MSLTNPQLEVEAVGLKRGAPWWPMSSSQKERTHNQAELDLYKEMVPAATGTASPLLRQRVLELVLQCKRNGHRNFCLSASVHKNDIAYNRLETSGTLSTEYLTGWG